MSVPASIRQALRAGGSGMRALLLARNSLHVAADLTTSAAALQTGSRASLRSRTRRRSSSGGSESCSWCKERLAVAGAACAAVAVSIATPWENATLCEALEEEEESCGDDESVDRKSERCEGGDSMSTYFDSDYEPKSLLGCGTFGVVMQCVHKQTGRVAAVKMVQDVAGNQEEVAREKEALERLERAGGHASIVGYEGSYYHNDFHYIVLEYVPGISLHSFMEKHHTLDSTWALQLVAQLASALVFMHEADVIHRDLKPENIMAVVNGGDGRSRSVDRSARGDAGDEEAVTLKIIDFGSAGRMSRPESSEKTRPATLSGTRCYWSPEVLQRQDVTAAMDMWALGCILYILISGRHPFDLMGCSTEEQVLHRVTTEAASFLLPVWHDVPPETKELIRALLEKDPRHRLSAVQMLEHPAIVAATKAA
ncbi:hypothetical protein BBJ28_00008513 [Nothophytophthora sp. Chile5]|nr:hypothetical protein BBJ28_00008513 [Nothophytophthora sp. Chile5]